LKPFQSRSQTQVAFFGWVDCRSGMVIRFSQSIIERNELTASPLRLGRVQSRRARWFATTATSRCALSPTTCMLGRTRKTQPTWCVEEDDVVDDGKHPHLTLVDPSNAPEHDLEFEPVGRTTADPSHRRRRSGHGHSPGSHASWRGASPQSPGVPSRAPNSLLPSSPKGLGRKPKPRPRPRRGGADRHPFFPQLRPARQGVGLEASAFLPPRPGPSAQPRSNLHRPKQRHPPSDPD
jgi:hypothetical protein